MGAAIVLHPDGTLIEINLKPNVPNHLPLKQEQLGCRRVDCVGLTRHLDMWIDDEGEGTQDLNLVASLLARRFGFVWQAYFGPVLLCGVDAEGNSVDLTDDQLRALLTHLLDITAPLTA